MLITSLELKNVGRHEALKFDTNSPVVGLLGPNGVGKSTVLEMVKFLFTGETEDAIVEQLRQIGTIGPETQFRDEHGTSHAA